MSDALASPPSPAADQPLVLVAHHGPVCTLTLNRPAALNSFTAALHAELRAALDAAAANTAVRAVVITGAGRGFCAGQDLNDSGMVPGAGGPSGTSGNEGARVDVGAVIEAHYRPLVLRIRSMPVPVLAMVNGVAAGAGANLALCCDLVVAARSASFIQAFAKIGLIPDCGGTWLLPRLVGRAMALGLAMTGDKLMAEEAAKLGLIWECVDDAFLTDTTLALAHRLAALPTQALVATRAALDAAGQLDLPEALSLEARVQRERGHSHDFAEGVAAFLNKRAAHFSDR